MAEDQRDSEAIGMKDLHGPPAAALLHNMSAPPKASISHTGPRAVQRCIWFGIPTRLSSLEEERFGTLAGWLGITLPSSPTEAERHLRLLANARAQTLPLPSACVVMQGHSLVTEEENDPLTIVTVLSKSSDHVYLRDKQPNFDRLTWGAHLALVIPMNWSPE